MSSIISHKVEMQVVVTLTPSCLFKNIHNKCLYNLIRYTDTQPFNRIFLSYKKEIIFGFCKYICVKMMRNKLIFSRYTLLILFINFLDRMA